MLFKCKITQMVLLFVMIGAVVFAAGCGGSKPSDSQLKEAVQMFLDSEDSVLPNYCSFDYNLTESLTQDTSFQAEFLVTAQSRVTNVTFALVQTWEKIDRGWVLRQCELTYNSANSITTNQAPMRSDIEKAVELNASRILTSSSLFDDTPDCMSWFIENESFSWDDNATSCIAEFTLAQVFPAFTSRRTYSCELYWECYDEAWRPGYSYPFSYLDKLVSYDFSALNGKWYCTESGFTSDYIEISGADSATAVDKSGFGSDIWRFQKPTPVTVAYSLSNEYYGTYRGTVSCEMTLSHANIFLIKFYHESDWVEIHINTHSTVVDMFGYGSGHNFEK